ncbi:hypothetical protein [Pandoraea anhela]|uniref:Uncharacterized protein n=1 Tax=Pandoraea anhela TaxID=2508295 RepID=A0A5E4TAV3_9BURK|nr:hypothetical protein [Pandoraea anhela]VVD83618.1 hypothetical protein PAN31108_01241 [Pandoraea anhela]
MNKVLWRIALVVACTTGLLATSGVARAQDGAITAIDGGQNPRLNGADVAYLINQRYANTPAKCFVRSPVQECSGVLLRTAPAGAAGDRFWRISPAEIAAGRAELSYARADLSAVNPPASVGFVLADRPTAAGNNQGYQLVCGSLAQDQGLAPCPEGGNTVGVSPWDANSPASLAVQAIYYDAGRGGQLAQALNYQKQYYDSTRQWVPVLRAFLANAAAGVALGFDERDQLDWGYAVVRNLEARYADTRMTCDGGSAGYDCAGVLIRATGFGGTFRSWNPSPNSVLRDGVSFSYVRSDMSSVVIGNAGVIMHELNYPSAYKLRWRCAFPQNAGTSARANSCNVGGEMRLCDALGITTAAQWRARYNSNSNIACGLGPSAAQFAVFADLRRQLFSGHNEIIIGAWPQNIPEQLPLQAFFYPGDAQRPGAQFIQQDYMSTTGRFMPIVRVRFSNPPGSIFTYSPDDQTGAMRPGALLAVPTGGDSD